jgi:uncharacterized glyoxalase superfamily protein PhnB
LTAGGELRVLVGAIEYDRLVAFYRDVLGLPVHEVWDGDDGQGTLFRAGAGIIELIADSPHHPAAPPQGVAVAIETDDVDGLYGRLRAAGADVTLALDDRAWGHRSFEIRDPAGMRLVFFSVIG